MSQENVEIVQRLYEAANISGVGVVPEFAHPDLEVVPPPNWPEASTLRGREQVQEFARQWMESFERFEVEPEQFVDPADSESSSMSVTGVGSREAIPRSILA